MVTAQRRAESAETIGMSIDALGGDELMRRGIGDSSDLVRVVPGFNFTETPWNTPVFTLRGIGFQESSLAAAPAVTVYVDEVPLPYPAMTRGASLDLERVEVLKGPQGTLYGQNSTGGAINYLAAKPTDSFEAGGEVSYGRFETVDTQGFVSGPVSDNLSARFAVRQLYSGEGWQESQTRDDTLGEKDQLIGRLLLDWRLSDTATLTVNFNGWTDKSDAMAGQFIAYTPLDEPEPGELPDEGDLRVASYARSSEDAQAADWDADKDFQHDDRFSQIAIRVDVEASESVNFTSLGAYQQYDTASFMDRDGTDRENNHLSLDGSITSYYQEFRLTGGTTSLDWVVGANYGRDTVDDVWIVEYRDSSVNPTLGIENSEGDHGSRQEVERYGIFGHLDYHLTDSLSLQAAARFTQSNRDFDGCSMDSGDGDLAAVATRVQGVFQPDPIKAATPTLAPDRIRPGECITMDTESFANGLVTDELNEDNVSWRTGISWTPADGVLLYGNVSKGFKEGGYPTLAGLFASQWVPVVQEEVTAYEAGFKATLFDRSLSLTGAAFVYDYKNKQLRGRGEPDPVFGALEKLINIPESKVEGAELQLTWLPFRGLTLNLGAGYTASEIEGDFISFTPDAEPQNFGGEPFPYMPEWQVVADLEYVWGAFENWDAYVGIGATYQGSTNNAFGQNPLYDVDAYTLYDARAGLTSTDGRWYLGIWGKNITDEYYWAGVYPMVDTTIRFTGMPATYGVKLGYRF